jgi:hypothetical protein
MSDKKIVNVSTEFVGKSGDALDDAMSLFTLGLVSGSKPDHYSTTVTYDDGSLGHGTGSTKEDSIKSAVKK